MELYDLADDIGEQRNGAADHPEIVAKFNGYFKTARTDSPKWPVTLTASRAKSAAASAP